MSKIHFTGIMPALITPLDKNGKVNVRAVKELMDDNYAKGVHGFYVTGGTGEGPLLSADQRKAMTDAAIEATHTLNLFRAGATSSELARFSNQARRF